MGKERRHWYESSRKRTRVALHGAEADTTHASIATAREVLADLEATITERLADLTTLEAAIQAMQRHLATHDREGHHRERDHQAS